MTAPRQGDPDVGVVIVNYRTPQLTLAAARSILPEPGVREVVIVDNASGDGSPEELRDALTDARVRLVQSDTNLGFGRGANLGVAELDSPFIFVLNSDATLRPGGIGQMRAVLMTEPTTGIVAPLVYGADGETLQRDAHGVFPSLLSFTLRQNKKPPETERPDWVSGVAFMIRRVDWQTVGGFDPIFLMYLEDIDLCRRLGRRGLGARRVTTASVIHLGGQSRQSASARLQQYRASQVAYFQRDSRPIAATIARIALTLAARKAAE